MSPSAPIRANVSAGSSLAFARRAESLLRSRAFDEAAAVLAEGTKKHPAYLTGFLLLGRAHKEGQRHAEASTALEKALQIDPRCPAALSLLAEISETLGDGAQAVLHLGLLAAQEPWDEKYQATYRRSRALAAPIPKASKPEPAESKIRAPVAAMPVWEEDDLEAEEEEAEGAPNVATITLAEIYFQQGLKEQALQIYRQILDYQPENQSVMKRIGEIEASVSSAK